MVRNELNFLLKEERVKMDKVRGNFFVPLVFSDRYFIYQGEEIPLLSVLSEHEGKVILELQRNQAVGLSALEIEKDLNTIKVRDKKSARMLYTINPGPPVTVILFKDNQEEIVVNITETTIQAGGINMENNMFGSNMACLLVEKQGGMGIGASLPLCIIDFLREHF